MVAALNGISFTFPLISILTQPEDLTEDMFCDGDRTNWPEECLGKKFCHCTYRIKVKLGSKVQLNLVDETLTVNRLNHPFHLHGFPFYVTNMAQLTQFDAPIAASVALFNAYTNETQRNTLGLDLTSNRPYGKVPPLMDTASIPSKGITSIRFRADNPGFWLMHCHFEYHMAVGMGLVIQVGEPKDFVKPPAKFPKCNTYVPDIDETVIKYKNLLP